jgi:hypothetical protein
VADVPLDPFGVVNFAQSGLRRTHIFQRRLLSLLSTHSSTTCDYVHTEEHSGDLRRRVIVPFI